MGILSNQQERIVFDFSFLLTRDNHAKPYLDGLAVIMGFLQIHALATSPKIGWQSDTLHTMSSVILLHDNSDVMFWIVAGLCLVSLSLIGFCLWQMKSSAGSANITIVRILRVYMR